MKEKKNVHIKVQCKARLSYKVREEESSQEGFYSSFIFICL